MYKGMIGYEVRVITNQTHQTVSDDEIHSQPIDFFGTMIGLDKQFLYLGTDDEPEIIIGREYIFCIINTEIQDIGELDQMILDDGGIVH